MCGHTYFSKFNQEIHDEKVIENCTYCLSPRTVWCWFRRRNIYLTSPDRRKNSTTEEIQTVKDNARYNGVFDKNQKGSNAVHWAEGKLYVNDKEIAFEGSVAPGPDYKIYLTKTQANDRESFMKIKEDSLYIGDLKNFGNFKKSLPNGVNIDEYTTVQIWCEKFEQFISSASFK